MDFSDDEDFFERAAEDQEELLPFEGYGCFQPHEEPPPEEDMIQEADDIKELLAEVHASSQPREEATAPEELSTSPSRTSDASSPATSSSPQTPPLPLQVGEVRKRLRVKTKPNGPWIGNDAPAPVEHASFQPLGFPDIPRLEEVKYDWWDGKKDREKKRYIWNYVKRNNLYNTYVTSFPKSQRRAYPEAWTSLEPTHLKEFVDWVCKNPACSLPLCVSMWWRKWSGCELSATERDPGLKVVDPGRQILMTWQGDWGLVKRKDAPETMGELSATEMLKKDLYIQSLWKKAMPLLEGFKKIIAADDMGASMELCTRTLAQGSIRIHLHACYISTAARLNRTELSALRVWGSIPHVSTESSKRQHRRRATQQSAMYYVIAPKIGSLFTISTMRPHYEFEVNAEWIWSLVALHKIELSAARRELVASGKI